VSGLFANIQGFFDASYSGRYVALLFAQFANAEPRAFGQMCANMGIALPKQDFSVRHEWRLPGYRDVKIADLALLDNSGEPLVLFELKDADGKKANDIQVSAYCKYIKSKDPERVQFVFLSRHMPSAKDDKALGAWAKRGVRIHRRRFRDLHAAMMHTSPLSQMLKEYLEDIGVGYVGDIDMRALAYLAGKSLNFQIGRVSGAQVASTPKALNCLFTNLSTLGDWIQAANKGLFSQSFKRHIYPELSYSKSKIKHLVQENGHDLDDELDLRDCVSSGTLWITAEGRLRVQPKHWALLEFGYYCDLEYQRRKKRKKGDGITRHFGMYAQLAVDGSEKTIRDISRLKCVELPSTQFPDERRAQDTLRKCLRNVFARSIKVAALSTASTLEKFKVP
jgi:hypothetical protein